jgi:hypothetical protein
VIREALDWLGALPGAWPGWDEVGLQVGGEVGLQVGGEVGLRVGGDVGLHVGGDVGSWVQSGVGGNVLPACGKKGRAAAARGLREQRHDHAG